MKFLPLASALLLTQCVKSPDSVSRLDEDKSIVFPSVLSLGSTPVDEQGKMYELDGVTLQALRVATQDFLPHGSEEGPCWRRPEGHRYVIIRKDNIIFVQIYADTASCMRGLMMLDYGGEYAISTDGRILRRRLPGDPDDSPASQTSQPDDGGLPPGEDYSAVLGSTTLSSRIALPQSWLDAGPRRHPVASTSDGGVSLDGGIPPDGGVPPGP
jgi:hypothetical protein